MEIGPAIPKHLLSDGINNHDCNNEQEIDDGKYGPALPPGINPIRETKHDTSNPVKPKTTGNDDETDQTDQYDCDDGDLYGPVLPPGFKQRNRNTIGPCRPSPGYQDNTETKSTLNNEDYECDEDGIGPKLPTQKEEDEYIIRRKAEIESRARVKSQSNEKEKKIEREEWMTELPPELGKNFGLGPRKFRSKEVNLGDRSVWTDTPSQKEHKKTSQSKPPERREKSKKEIDMEKYVSEHNKKGPSLEISKSCLSPKKRYRSKSLLDLHQSDQKKKKKTDERSERKPFDRETDLGLRQMDVAKRKSLIKQSTNLNSKFQHSKQGPTYL